MTTDNLNGIKGVIKIHSKREILKKLSFCERVGILYHIKLCSVD